MKLPKKTFKANVIPETTIRRLRSTPSYFFLVWRWSTWLYALIIIIDTLNHYPQIRIYQTMFTALLVITFLQTLIVTLYAPVFQMFLPRLPRLRLSRATGSLKQIRSGSYYPLAEDEEPDILTPLARTRNLYWDIAIYGVDVLICGLVMYYSAGPYVLPFGYSSPFYRYGMSTAFAAALAYRYRGGLIAALGYDLFSILGMFVPAPGATFPYPPTSVDIVGSLIDTPLSAILVAYIATLLASYTQSKRREQDNARTRKSLIHVGETLMKGTTNRQELLQHSVGQIRQGGHFHRLVIALVNIPNNEADSKDIHPTISTCVEASLPDSELPDKSIEYIKQIMQSKEKLVTFEPVTEDPRHKEGIARFYLPLFKDEQVQMVLGAESRRETPFGQRQEEFLTIVGAQLLVALDNIRLTEQMVQLAEEAERGRIAREIHDGIAQLTYMLSLNAETCAAQAQRIAEASEEDAELITPLARRLDKLVTVSKQALWETRNYMFSLKPLMSGSTTLTQMLTNQLREFETISDLPVQLEVDGVEELPDGNQQHSRRYAQIGTAIFRIVQEALTNAYKHAEATQLQVHLHYLPESIEVEICDNGHGLQTDQQSNNSAVNGEHQRIYSGHGLRGMRERAQELGGTVEIAQQPTGGVKVRARIPL
ncbi:MAG TPA: GAF domain-containing sensor histidine kinase [Ktedonobacteraceae bacterium]|nr:GAF domain-containing sensor histidine kinase [Ktedonobacteraceae bacterium]